MLKSLSIDFEYTYPFVTTDDYQQCFLNIFNLKDFDDNVIDEKTTALLKEFKTNKSFVDTITYLANKMMSDDLEVGLFLLFSFEHLHNFISVLKVYSKEEDLTKYDFTGFLEEIKKRENAEINSGSNSDTNSDTNSDSD